MLIRIYKGTWGSRMGDLQFKMMSYEDVDIKILIKYHSQSQITMLIYLQLNLWMTRHLYSYLMPHLCLNILSHGMLYQAKPPDTSCIILYQSHTSTVFCIDMWYAISYHTKPRINTIIGWYRYKVWYRNGEPCSQDN